ncbi:MAG: ATP-grasp domain-containing protein [Acidobacteria bacterium]|nr:ATP-grasp domain-containing protein [Acidobacteriota bacterium]
MPERVLIANRGEIAIRVARTCRAAGVEVVTVCTAEDAESPHLHAGHWSREIGSYTDPTALCDAATETGCDAIHPGYGFLSENPTFVRAANDAGLTFIGPPAEAMEVMGSKTAARAAMQAAGVPVVPGTEPGDADTLRAAADELGYPVFLKAVAGGGGKGMSIVDDPDELERVFRQATAEAAKSFGNGDIYLERVVLRPRHIEIQVFADTHGNTVAFGERECSIQRRHQKIVEEAPSPAVSPELREEMSAAAIAAAEAVKYVGAGTVEFLLGDSGEFYFLEMNTRLQVEHPVTEWITGLDLVRLQLEVAAGSTLPPEALNPTFLGHAIECRIYAEDPGIGHLPQTGKLLLMREPAGPGVRIDSALREGQEIGMQFDPMLAKLSCWGPDRATAIDRTLQALRNYVLLGVRTNLDHLQDVVATEAFRAGDVTTAFLDEHMSEWPQSDEIPALAAAATALARSAGSSGAGSTSGTTLDRLASDPWRTLGGFRVADPEANS